MWVWWHKQKKELQTIIATGVIILTIAIIYKLAIEQTYDAWCLRKQLQGQLESKGENNGLDIQLQRKRNFYQKALKHYHVMSEDIASHNWEQLSSLALSTGLKVGFAEQSKEISDSVLIKQKTVLRPYEISGGYQEIVSFLDSMGKKKQVGWIYELKIGKPKNHSETEEQSKQDLIVYITTAALK